MIRVTQKDGWLLIDHRDHAHLAGEFAAHWNNADFAPPEPRADVITAVRHHDDGWVDYDAAPMLTRDGRPAAFSQDLVGRYSAFEEVDLEPYLRVRARATEALAAHNPYAAILVSMHTVNLLTERADLTSFTAAQRSLHARFVSSARARQEELVRMVAREPARAADVAAERLQHAFEFLQACDSLSLMVCVDYPQPRPLRHSHPRRSGEREIITCTRIADRRFRVAPWPFDTPDVRCTVRARRIAGATFADRASFRAACAAAQPVMLETTLVP